jgi:type I restriction enzyme S subunit
MVLIPSDDELKIMDDIISPLISKVILNNNQLNKLETLRDTLHPKLMSGEVRVQTVL